MLGLSIPLFNEEVLVDAVVRRLHRDLDAAEVPHRLVLVDNGSRDGTGRLVDRLGADLPGVHALHLPTNVGYGGGIRAGLPLLGTPFVGWHWGDGQIQGHVVAAAWHLLREGNFDLVKARRIRREDGFVRRVVSLGYQGATRWVAGLPDDDVNGCPKIMNREVLLRLDLRSDDWLLDLEAMCKARQSGLRVGTVDAEMKARPGGRSKVRARTIVDFARVLVQVRRGQPPWA